MNWANKRLGIGRGIAALRGTANVDLRYVAYSLRAKMPDLHSMAAGSTFEAVTADVLGALRIPVATLEEQRRIADFLDDRVARIDRIIGARREQIRLAVLARDGVFRDLTTISGTDMCATGLDWMPFVSSTWGLPRLSYVFRTGSGSTPPATEQEYYDGPVSWVNTGDICDGWLRETSRCVTELALNDYSTLVKYQPGSLVIAMYGQGATKGRVALLGIEACVNQACCVLSADADLTEWGFFWFRAHKPAIVSLALGGGQPNLSQEIIRALRIPIPPKGTRQDNLKALREVEASTTRATAIMRSQVAGLEEYKQSLITAAVTGQLDVTTAGSGIPG